MKLFHGTKFTFDTFSVDYPGTGEAGNIHAIWFANNFTAARNHARQVGNYSQCWVYECELAADAVLMKADISLNQQPAIQKQLTNVLPVCISVQTHYDTLFADYFRFNKIDPEYHDDHEITLLRHAGIDAIYDYERGWQDAHLHGATTVVLTPEKIRILAVHDV
ncbi:hypothetical protein SerAS12_0074 [Serratia sp. AS12]|uniref:hypothetical protein n=1 Tax=Serratia TaxID=613 RepID=UPI00020E9444|nr:MULTISPECIES: hypothetical protein [Serratia]AEF43237.1 hypothetical protein SerAS9_0074 [Serratia plymuthica AS9]AEF48189.1 hypothetical protein SerAS12_0074 [Serratia sp. AS12]AEG25897.1 hypothetical protein SerAS13_0074 [Serratia sp. AS13]UTN96811.1 hypothetical protein NLX81_00370 [Serratia plymuthica]